MVIQRTEFPKDYYMTPTANKINVQKKKKKRLVISSLRINIHI